MVIPKSFSSKIQHKAGMPTLSTSLQNNTEILDRASVQKEGGKEGEAEEGKKERKDIQIRRKK